MRQGADLVCGHAPKQAQGTESVEEIGAVAGKLRATQGQREGQGRASVPSDQAAVRIRKDAVSGLGQEHCGPNDDVRAGQSVDGSAAAVGGAVMSVSALGETRLSAQKSGA